MRLLDFTQMLLIYPNVSNFTQNLKLSILAKFIFR